MKHKVHCLDVKSDNMKEKLEILFEVREYTDVLKKIQELKILYL